MFCGTNFYDDIFSDLLRICHVALHFSRSFLFSLLADTLEILGSHVIITNETCRTDTVHYSSYSLLNFLKKNSK